MQNTQLREFMSELVAKMPTCSKGNYTSAADFGKAQAIFQRYDLYLGNHHLDYMPPTGGLIFLQSHEGETKGAAVVRKHDRDTAEVRIAFELYGFPNTKYATPLLHEAINMAKELGYKFLATGDMGEDDKKHNLTMLLHEYGFRVCTWRRQQSVFDDGLYFEIAL